MLTLSHDYPWLIVNLPHNTRAYFEQNFVQFGLSGDIQIVQLKLFFHLA